MAFKKEYDEIKKDYIEELRKIIEKYQYDEDPIKNRYEYNLRLLGNLFCSLSSDHEKKSLKEDPRYMYYFTLEEIGLNVTASYDSDEEKIKSLNGENYDIFKINWGIYDVCKIIKSLKSDRKKIEQLIVFYEKYGLHEDIFADIIASLSSAEFRIKLAKLFNSSGDLIKTNGSMTEDEIIQDLESGKEELASTEKRDGLLLHELEDSNKFWSDVFCLDSEEQHNSLGEIESASEIVAKLGYYEEEREPQEVITSFEQLDTTILEKFKQIASDIAEAQMEQKEKAAEQHHENLMDAYNTMEEERRRLLTIAEEYNGIRSDLQKRIAQLEAECLRKTSEQATPDSKLTERTE